MGHCFFSIITNYCLLIILEPIHAIMRLTFMLQLDGLYCMILMNCNYFDYIFFSLLNSDIEIILFIYFSAYVNERLDISTD